MCSVLLERKKHQTLAERFGSIAIKYFFRSSVEDVKAIIEVDQSSILSILIRRKKSFDGTLVFAQFVFAGTLLLSFPLV